MVSLAVEYNSKVIDCIDLNLVLISCKVNHVKVKSEYFDLDVDMKNLIESVPVTIKLDSKMLLENMLFLQITMNYYLDDEPRSEIKNFTLPLFIERSIFIKSKVVDNKFNFLVFNSKISRGEVTIESGILVSEQVEMIDGFKLQPGESKLIEVPLISNSIYELHLRTSQGLVVKRKLAF